MSKTTGCKTTTTTIITKKHIFYDEVKNISTNTCTGASQSYSTWGFGYFGGMFGFLGIIFATFILMAIILNLFDD